MPKPQARVLIVDDERSIRELLEIFLKKEGFVMSTAASAEEGLAQVRGAASAPMNANGSAEATAVGPRARMNGTWTNSPFAFAFL